MIIRYTVLVLSWGVSSDCQGHCEGTGMFIELGSSVLTVEQVREVKVQLVEAGSSENAELILTNLQRYVFG